MIRENGFLSVLIVGLQLVKIILSMFTAELGKRGKKGKAIFLRKRYAIASIQRIVFRVWYSSPPASFV